MDPHGVEKAARAAQPRPWRVPLRAPKGGPPGPPRGAVPQGKRARGRRARLEPRPAHRAATEAPYRSGRRASPRLKRFLDDSGARSGCQRTRRRARGGTPLRAGMAEEIDAGVLRKYEIQQKLGKGVRCFARWNACRRARGRSEPPRCRRLQPPSSTAGGAPFASAPMPERASPPPAPPQGPLRVPHAPGTSPRQHDHPPPPTPPPRLRRPMASSGVLSTSKRARWSP